MRINDPYSTAANYAAYLAALEAARRPVESPDTPAADESSLKIGHTEGGALNSGGQSGEQQRDRERREARMRALLMRGLERQASELQAAFPGIDGDQAMEIARKQHAARMYAVQRMTP